MRWVYCVGRRPAVVYRYIVCMYKLCGGSFALCLYALEGPLVAVLLASAEMSLDRIL
jgi:hypothetical protein